MVFLRRKEKVSFLLWGKDYLFCGEDFCLFVCLFVDFRDGNWFLFTGNKKKRIKKKKREKRKKK